MNRSHFEHLGFALLVQAVIGLLTGNWWAGAAAGAFFFLGREHAQAEHRYIYANGGARYLTPAMPELAALNPRHWRLDDVLDCVVPVAGVAGAAFLLE